MTGTSFGEGTGHETDCEAPQEVATPSGEREKLERAGSLRILQKKLSGFFSHGVIGGQQEAFPNAVPQTESEQIISPKHERQDRAEEQSVEGTSADVNVSQSGVENVVKDEKNGADRPKPIHRRFSEAVFGFLTNRSESKELLDSASTSDAVTDDGRTRSRARSNPDVKAPAMEDEDREPDPESQPETDDAVTSQESKKRASGATSGGVFKRLSFRRLSFFGKSKPLEEIDEEPA